jgi:hypothetical protein
MVLYLCVLIMFSLHRESLKLILVDEPLLEVVLSQLSSRRSLENVISSQNPALSSQVSFLSYSGPNQMKLGHKGHLNTMNKFLKVFFPNPTISLLISDELKNLGFGGMRRNL